jgi:hypothetical protein
MKNYNKLLFALALCVINNTYSKNVMQGAPIPTLKGSEFHKFCLGYEGFVINKQGQVDPIWVTGAIFALLDDRIYGAKLSDLAWLLWNEMEGLADIFSEGNQQVKAAVEQSFNNTFNEALGRPATTPVLKTRPATVEVSKTVTTQVSKTLPTTRISRPSVVVRQPAARAPQVSARTSFIEKSQMRGMKFTEITNDWLREAMDVALNGSMLTSGNRDAIQQAMTKIAEEAILPSLRARGIEGVMPNEIRERIQTVVGQFMMNQGTTF